MKHESSPRNHEDKPPVDAAAFREDIAVTQGLGKVLSDEELAQFRSGPQIDPQQEEQRLREYFEAFPDRN